jgi:formate dehydrogenase major subunit
MSCTTPIRDGMVVRTDTEALMQTRRTIVDLLLSNGEHDCASCDIDGICELQEVAHRLGLEKASEPWTGTPVPIDLSHPLIARNQNRCILCQRCVKGCNTTVINEVLDVAYRGHNAAVISDLGVQLCPAGALVERKAQRQDGPWKLETVRTTCPYCGVGCQMLLHVDRSHNRVVKVTGVEGAAPNDGMLCVKGRFAYDFPSSPKRLTHPLIKKNGKHQPVSWDEALDYTASRLRQIRDAHGTGAISAVTSSRDDNENCYAAQKLMRAVIGNNNIDNCART